MSLALTAGALAASTAITRARALTVANAINLRHSDLSGLTEQPNPLTAQDRAENARLTKCVGGVPDGEALGIAQSPNFVSSGAASSTISSEVEIVPTPKLAAKDLASISGPRGIPCLESELASSLRVQAPKDEHLTVHGATLPSPVSGSDGAFSIRITIVVRVTKGTTVVSEPIYADEIGFIYGQAEVSLSDVDILGKPSATLERRLAALLLTRTRAAVG
jgi:hypothetical protein